jgi:hypothetical protein
VLEVGTQCLLPEVTVTADGIYWHPLISPAASDMHVTETIFPLADGVRRIQQRLAAEREEGAPERQEFT